MRITPDYPPADPVIVVGAGPAGLRCVEVLSELDPDLPIKVFSGEAFKPYDRVKLSLLLARDIRERAVYCPGPSGASVRLFDNCPIHTIDRYSRSVQDADGEWHAYSKLVLALGSEPHVPGIPNVGIGNVFTFRDIRDTEALLARNLRSRHTVVLGGGLLGLEAARAMLRNNTRVTVVQQGKHLMNRQLDAGAAALLRAKVEALGIEVICPARVKALVADSCSYNTSKAVVGGVELDTGAMLVCDTVIVATGIRPRVALARDHGLAVATGIRVDEHLRTSDEHIYAIGECCQFRGQIHGLVAPGLEQAAVAARHIFDETTTYRGAIESSSLKVAGLQVFSTGEVNTEISASIRSSVYNNPETGTYRAIFTVHGRLTGALAIGSWPEQNRIRATIGEGRRIQVWNRLLFALTGCLWQTRETEDIATWPAAMVVCNCKGVTRGTLSAAKQAGATTCAALSAATGAATVCGSCKPLLEQFTGASPTQAASGSVQWLWRLGILAGCLPLLYWIVGPLPFSASVQAPWPERLWLDGTAKQISGFSLLGLALFSLLMSLNKRLRWLNFMQFTSWRVLHAALGSLAVLTLLIHTGANLGANLNRWLMLDFMAILLLGGAAAMLVSREQLLPARLGKRLRGNLTWAHTLLFWPLPALLAFHVVSVYYF
jgi:nitrite reductase (NADH) large subunit